jgi:hypothetical protein
METYASGPSVSGVGGNSASGDCSKSNASVACPRRLHRARRSSSRSKARRRARIRASRWILRERSDRHRSARRAPSSSISAHFDRERAGCPLSLVSPVWLCSRRGAIALQWVRVVCQQANESAAEAEREHARSGRPRSSHHRRGWPADRLPLIDAGSLPAIRMGRRLFSGGHSGRVTLRSSLRHYGQVGDQAQLGL